ncbi:hypothetical protein K450DRAFT_224505 [Umbelopsis ramanniana AG]|uniref:Uncharacterized protein n=1 Tax=Umbelopsis ramanniana AG TaxID=1314678 RepID=A0AAD5EGU1_UMBRA|nr:uncharacterized protein K450DRAFT_224505 [Umbelopsis ramanniana AG]KAI8583162.1 hypothetical protein K450DRAFT_224505 [Umbelopsis ramanniana AG]
MGQRVRSKKCFKWSECTFFRAKSLLAMLNLLEDRASVTLKGWDQRGRNFFDTADNAVCANGALSRTASPTWKLGWRCTVRSMLHHLLSCCLHLLDQMILLIRCGLLFFSCPGLRVVWVSSEKEEVWSLLCGFVDSAIVGPAKVTYSSIPCLSVLTITCNHGSQCPHHSFNLPIGGRMVCRRKYVL